MLVVSWGTEGILSFRTQIRAGYILWGAISASEPSTLYKVATGGTGDTLRSM